MKPKHFKFQSFFLKADGAFCNHSFQTLLVIKIKVLDRQQQNEKDRFLKDSNSNLTETEFIYIWKIIERYCQNGGGTHTNDSRGVRCSPIFNFKEMQNIHFSSRPFWPKSTISGLSSSIYYFII